VNIYVLIPIIIIYVSIIYFLRSESIVALIGPESGFVWGESGEWLEDRIGLRKRVFHGIIIGFLASALANAIFFKKSSG